MPVLRWTSEGGQASALGGGLDRWIDGEKKHMRWTCLVCCVVDKKLYY